MQLSLPDNDFSDEPGVTITREQIEQNISDYSRYGPGYATLRASPARGGSGVRALGEGASSSYGGGSGGGRYTRYERGNGSPVHGTPAPAMPAAGGPVAQEWYAKVDALVARGMTRERAVCHLAKTEPALHLALLREANPGKDVSLPGHPRR